jgi:hypothetical protein
MSDFEVISVYSRAQAMSDGVVIDISDLAREAGFKWPVAVTDHLYHGYIVPALDLAQAGQSISGRLWDVFSVLRAAISTGKDLSSLNFTVSFLMAPTPLLSLSSSSPSRAPATQASRSSPSCFLRTTNHLAQGFPNQKVSPGPYPNPLFLSTAE